LKQLLKTIVRVLKDFASGNSIHEGFDFVKILLAGRSFHTGTETRCMGNTHFNSKENVFRCTAEGRHTSFGVFNPGGAKDFNPCLNLLGPEKPGPPPRGGIFEGHGFLTFENRS